MKRISVILALAAFSVLLACGGSQEVEMENGGAATMEKDEYIGQVQARIDRLDERITELSSGQNGDNQANGAGAQSAQIEDYRNRLKAVVSKVDQLRSATGESWMEMKADIDRSLDDLENSIGKGTTDKSY